MSFPKKFIFILFFFISIVLFFSNQILASETPREWEWAQKIGGNGQDYGKSNSVDSNGNSIVVGHFQSNSISFGETTLVSSGLTDIFISKTSSTGEQLWIQKAGGTDWDYGEAVDIDSDGNYLIAGYFAGTASFGGDILVSSGSSDIFVAKLSSNGERLRAKNAGGIENDRTYTIDIDSNGNSFIAGFFNGTASFGNKTLVSSGGYEAFIAKISNTGEWEWAQKAGGTNYDRAETVNVDSDGNVFIAGEFAGTASFGNDILVSSGGDDFFIAKLSNNGERLRAKRAGGTSQDVLVGISIDINGNPFVVGYFEGTTTAGDTTLVSNGGYDVFVAKLSSNGERLRAKNAGGTDYDIGRKIILNSEENLLIAGYFKGTASFGNKTLISSGLYDIFVAKISNTGEWLLAQKAGGTDDDRLYSINLDSSGNPIIAGAFKGTASFGNKTVSSAAFYDAFIAKLGHPWVILPNSTNNNEVVQSFEQKNYQFSGGYLSGSKPIGLEKTNGNMPLSLNIKNGLNKLHLPQNLQFKQADNITNYNSTINLPTDYAVATVDSKPVISAISVGSNTEVIKLVNDVATLSIPAIGKSIGDPLSIYSSQDGTNWIFEKGAIVKDIDGQLYAEFTTNHFTYFAIAGSTGSFVINNDDGFTNILNVTLTISAPGAINMRFGNTTGELDSASWETYSTSKSWTLLAENGLRTVYAEFDIDNDQIADASTLDTITYFVPGAEEGQLSLEILTGSSECVYGTSLYLGEQNVKLNEAYSFSGSFSGQRYCADYVGNFDGWVFTIGVGDIDNGNGGIISGSNLSISHGGAITQGDSACTGYDGAASEFYTTPYTLIEKSSGSDKICKVTLSDVNIEINVPANQAPGSYAGTLTIYVPNF